MIFFSITVEMHDVDTSTAVMAGGLFNYQI